MDEELAAPHERTEVRRGYRNGVKARTLTGPTGPLALTLPRESLFAAAGEQEWTPVLLPRYQRRVRKVNEAAEGTCLAGGNTRRIRRTLQPLLEAAPLSKSAVSRVVATDPGHLRAMALIKRSAERRGRVQVLFAGFATGHLESRPRPRTCRRTDTAKSRRADGQ